MLRTGLQIAPRHRYTCCLQLLAVSAIPSSMCKLLLLITWRRGNKKLFERKDSWVVKFDHLLPGISSILTHSNRIQLASLKWGTT